MPNGWRCCVEEICLSSDRRRETEDKLTQAMLAMQARLSSTLSVLPTKASDLLGDLARILRRAILDEVLQNGAYQVGKLLRLSSPDHSGIRTLTGGPKQFKRPPAQKETHFVRDDGAVVHFSLTIREVPSQPIELVAYGFEVYFPDQEPIRFLRFDLNQQGHENDDLGLRSHLHPGHDDLQLPCPWLSPVDALTFLLHGCRPRRETPRG
jgi:hypothetical protein